MHGFLITPRGILWCVYIAIEISSSRFAKSNLVTHNCDVVMLCGILKMSTLVQIMVPVRQQAITRTSDDILSMDSQEKNSSEILIKIYNIFYETAFENMDHFIPASICLQNVSRRCFLIDWAHQGHPGNQHTIVNQVWKTSFPMILIDTLRALNYK